MKTIREGPIPIQVIWFAFANITGEVAPSKTLYAVFPQGFAQLMTTNSISANELFIDWTNREEHSRGGAKSISNYESVVNEVSLPTDNEQPKSSVLLFATKVHAHSPVSTQCSSRVRL